MVFELKIYVFLQAHVQLVLALMLAHLWHPSFAVLEPFVLILIVFVNEIEIRCHLELSMAIFDLPMVFDLWISHDAFHLAKTLEQHLYHALLYDYYSSI